MGRALNLFNSMPAMLSSPHIILSPGKIQRESRKKDYDDAREWLCDSKLLNRCRCGSDPGAAITLSEDMNQVKCYLLDTGPLMSLTFRGDRDGLAETYSHLLDGKLSVNKGMIFESMVAQELVCRA